MPIITTGRVHDKKKWQQAGYCAIDVTVKSSKGAKDLAPTWDMVKRYKDETLSEKEYTKQYLKILQRSRHNNPEKWLNTLRKFDKIVFLCYCDVLAGDFCHRLILVEEFTLFAILHEIKVTVLPETKPPTRKTFSGFVTSLKKDEIFVFGSNDDGFHGAGAAGQAMRGNSDRNWRQDVSFTKAMNSPIGHPDRIGGWAVYGVGRGHQVGTQGESYGIATVITAGNRRSISLDEILSQLKELGEFATKNPNKTFFCAINGGGYNGYSKEEIATVYSRWVKEEEPPLNILFPDDISKLMAQPNNKKFVVAGGRDFNDYQYMTKCLLPLITQNDTIISGTAKGADSLGEKYAADHNIKVSRKPANWNLYGKSAGYRRNEEMAIEGDVLCAFWDEKSRGTKHMIDLAYKHKLEVHVFKYN